MSQIGMAPLEVISAFAASSYYFSPTTPNPLTGYGIRNGVRQLPHYSKSEATVFIGSLGEGHFLGYDEALVRE